MYREKPDFIPANKFVGIGASNVMPIWSDDPQIGRFIRTVRSGANSKIVSHPGAQLIPSKFGLVLHLRQLTAEDHGSYNSSYDTRDSGSGASEGSDSDPLSVFRHAIGRLGDKGFVGALLLLVGSGLAFGLPNLLERDSKRANDPAKIWAMAVFAVVFDAIGIVLIGLAVACHFFPLAS